MLLIFDLKIVMVECGRAIMAAELADRDERKLEMIVNVSDGGGCRENRGGKSAGETEDAATRG